MKRTVGLLNVLLLMVTLLLCGCTAQEKVIVSNDVYTIVEQDGQIVMKVENKSVISLTEDMREYKPPTYRTPGAMRTAIRECKFTQSDYEAISYMALCYGGSIPLFNLDTLSEPVLPDNMEYSSVTWDGERYYFHFNMDAAFDKDVTSGTVYVINKNIFDRELKKQITNYFDNDNLTLDKTEEDAKRGGTIYYYHTSSHSMKLHILTLTQGTKTLYIREKYYSTYSSTPDQIYILGKDGDNYFSVLAYNFKGRPAQEWYLSFGLVPYVENTTTS